MRASLEAKIADAQGQLSSQLSALAQVENADPTVSAELRNQLTVLKQLSQSVATANPATLAQLRAEVASTVAAANSSAQQAQAASDKASPAIDAETYARRTAELDKRVAATFADDKRHNDEAHARAARMGIDLNEQDEARARLEQERKEAIARGDKLAERKADLALAQNTYGTMTVTGASQADLDEQQRILQIRREALEEQAKLEAGLAQRQAELAGNEKTSLSTWHDERRVEADRRTALLGGAGSSQETRLRLETEIRAAVANSQRDETPTEKIEAALTPEAREAARKAMQNVTADLGGFSLDNIGPVALAEGPDAHTKTEMPKVPNGFSSKGRAIV